MLASTLHDYVILHKLGSGSYGVVHLAQHKSTSEYYAIKQMVKTEIIRMKQVDHVLSEKLILSKINFPFIVGYRESFQDDINLYVVMEYVPGGELFKYLRTVGKFDPVTAKFYIAQVVLALEHLHKMGVAYRDLKPENITLDSRGHIRIVDFGFAKYLEDRTWTTCGTPDYMAPEIIQSKGHHHAVDWWTVGILLFEMLVGYPPFISKTPMQTYQKIVKGDFFFPSFMETNAIDLIKQLLELDLTKRLGNLKNGSADVKNHPYFSDVDWDSLLHMKSNGPLYKLVAQHMGIAAKEAEASHSASQAAKLYIDNIIELSTF